MNNNNQNGTTNNSGFKFNAPTNNGNPNITQDSFFTKKPKRKIVKAKRRTGNNLRR